jgi:hypothetical protein
MSAMNWLCHIWNILWNTDINILISEEWNQKFTDGKRIAEASERLLSVTILIYIFEKIIWKRDWPAVEVYQSAELSTLLRCFLQMINIWRWSTVLMFVLWVVMCGLQVGRQCFGGTMLQPRRPTSTSSLPWEPQI